MILLQILPCKISPLIFSFRRPGHYHGQAGKAVGKNLPSFDLLIVSRGIRENPSEDNQGKIAGILKIQPEEFNVFISNGIKENSIFFAATDLNKNQVLAIKYLNPDGYYIIRTLNAIT